MFEDDEDWEYLRDTVSEDHEPVWPHADIDFRYLGLEIEDDFFDLMPG
jgi:hypothetical protein